MLDIIGKKWLYFLLSGLVIVPGIVSLFLWGIRPSIEFTGGTLIEYRISPHQDSEKTNTQKQLSVDEVKKTVEAQSIEMGSIQNTSQNTYLFRLKPIDETQHQKIVQALNEKYGDVKEIRFETVGPTIGAETTKNAAKSVFVASVAIVIYIAWAFRKIPSSYSSFKFGICAVVALIHDVLLVIGIFSLLGHFYHVEVDNLFITSLLTIMGFSVHDTIVVFDRIRENLNKMMNAPFSQVVNESILQTLARSLSTSLTVIMTLTALLLFGGESIRWFIVALLVGIISGTYSSIFNASPLLVVWEEWGKRKTTKN